MEAEIRNPTHMVMAVCAAQAMGASGTMYFPALLPAFQLEWQLSNIEAGWITGVFYAGYAAAVPVLVSLTDRIDARQIFLLSCAAGAAAMLGFAFFADGAWSAALWRLLAGIGFAAAYMPGARALSDRLDGAAQVRAVAIYTAFSAVGSAASVGLAGLLAALLGWRWGAAATAIGPLLAAAAFAAVVAPKPLVVAADGRLRDLFDIRRVLRNRPAVGYMLAYAVHSFELFGYRAWLVAFLAASLALQPANALPLGAPLVATVIMLAGVPASILGNEGAMRWGRRRAISAYVGLTALIGCGLGFGLTWPFAVVAGLALVYGMATMLDSGSLTAGLVASANEADRGVTMAVHSFLGFGAGLLAPLAFGAVLDIAGTGSLGWGLAFAGLALTALTGPLWLRLFGSGKGRYA